MKPSSKLSGILAAASLALVASPLWSAPPLVRGQTAVAARLSGYQETPQTINSPGSGEFLASIHQDGTAIDFELTYRDLSSAVTQSHIHFGRPATSGSIVLFLCTNLTPPAGVPTPQACPAAGTVTGTLTAADVLPVTAQGIDAGATGFDEILQAIRNGAAYANVHTTNHGGGEIRGRLFTHGPH